MTVDLDTITRKPIWRLTLAELDALPDQERRWASSLLFDMKKDGTLAMLAANDPRTTYHVGYDRELGWALKPFCTCDHGMAEQRRWIAAYLENSCDGQSAAGTEK